MYQDFAYKGIKFHLNDNRGGISKCNYEYFPKYNCMMWVQWFHRWQSIGKFNTKAEAMAYIKENWNNL